jgi:hypothetical protein
MSTAAETCQHANCTSPGLPCFLPDDPDDAPSFHFCAEHAPDEGFCWACGGFFAGIESFDSSRTGLCENCEADAGDDDDWTDEDCYDDDY